MFLHNEIVQVWAKMPTRSVHASQESLSSRKAGEAGASPVLCLNDSCASQKALKVTWDDQYRRAFSRLALRVTHDCAQVMEQQHSRSSLALQVIRARQRRQTQMWSAWSQTMQRVKMRATCLPALSVSCLLCPSVSYLSSRKSGCTSCCNAKLL